jgi:hypothetical protein
VLFSGDLERDAFSGGRFTAGAWLDDRRTFSVEGSAFFLGERADPVLFSSGRTPVLTRPLIDAATGTEAAHLVAFPSLSRGAVVIDNPHLLWGGEANGAANLCRGDWYLLDALAGFRYLDLEESLRIREASQFSPTETALPLLAGGRFEIQDQFGARNQFYGGQLGLDAQVRHEDLFVTMRAQVALGSNHQAIDTNGNQRFTAATGESVSAPTGLLALPSNSGRFTRDRFAVVPEFSLNAGMDLTQRVQVFIGYTFVYLSDAARPGGQIDRAINFNQPLDGSAGTAGLRPAVLFKGTDYWAQGLNVGLSLVW